LPDFVAGQPGQRQLVCRHAAQIEAGLASVPAAANVSMRGPEFPVETIRQLRIHLVATGSYRRSEQHPDSLPPRSLTHHRLNDRPGYSG